MISRRAFMLGAVAVGCSRSTATPLPAPSTSSSAPSTSPTLGKTRLLEWTMRASDERVVVIVPDPIADHESLRVVFALHGRGESLKPPTEGAMGWARDYALTHAIERISNPPLAPADFENLVDDVHLVEMNRALAAKPFGRLAIVCPYVPDIDPYDSEKVGAYGKYLVDSVLARARNELPISSLRVATGIDGVSLGGAIALVVGLTRPDVFGAVGALQPAIRSEKIGNLTMLAAQAKKNMLPKLRLTTSHDDYFRAAVAETSATWTAAGVAHDFADLPGPHDYVFNRGPGGMELLFWQDRALVLRE